jgi:hypothetical protein
VRPARPTANRPPTGDSLFGIFDLKALAEGIPDAAYKPLRGDDKETAKHFSKRRFRAQTANLPRATEAERLVIQRIGQDVFRDALMDYWGGPCPMTGITEPALLRASHIVPWAECTDEQRLDVHNGLLLSALWDAAFDRGLISFADDGTVLAGPDLSETSRGALGIVVAPRLAGLSAAHRANLARHRPDTASDPESGRSPRSRRTGLSEAPSPQA